MHASGGFVTSGPMSIGVDRFGVNHIVGEAGREWVMNHADGTTSVVPIENRKYLAPYAETIASMLGERGVHNHYTIGEMTVPAGSALAAAMDAVFSQAQALQAKGAA